MVNMAFGVLDKDGSGEIEPDDIVGAFDEVIKEPKPRQSLVDAASVAQDRNRQEKEQQE